MLGPLDVKLVPECVPLVEGVKWCIMKSRVEMFGRCYRPLHVSALALTSPVLPVIPLMALLQELGGCGVTHCYWAHGTDDLEIRAFSFHFPLVNAIRQTGEWDRVAKKPSAVKTGKGKQVAQQGRGPSAWGNAPHQRSA